LRVLSFSWKFVLAALLALSLTINIALFIGGSFYKMASSAFGALTGVRTLVAQHADEVAQLSLDLADERAAKKKMNSELTEAAADLSTRHADEVAKLSSELADERFARNKLRGEMTNAANELATERVISKELRSELADPHSRVVTFRGRKLAIRDAVDDTAKRISKRAVVTSSREVGSMAGEALPYVGVAVIVGATALELKDLCDTLKDMGELQKAVSPEATDDEGDATTVCNQQVPSKEDLWEMAKNSPKSAWLAAKGAVPTLDELKNYDPPDIDWSQAWSVTMQNTDKAWVASKDGTGKAWAVTKQTAGGAVETTRTVADGVRGWFYQDESAIGEEN
jgi:hypothetical protein